MGGGDLNAKKAWHPNTMKNQERVWKAEQAAAEEKKRIMELQKERALERDREELNKLARDTLVSTNSASDSQLHWMYNDCKKVLNDNEKAAWLDEIVAAEAKIEAEIGKRDAKQLSEIAAEEKAAKVPQSSSHNEKPDKKIQQEDFLLGKAIDKNYDQANKPDQNEIPAVSRRVIGSSMLSIPGDVQVDLARKLREDPLLLVKERERAARAALLNNPVQRSRLTKLLRKEQEQKNANSEKKAKKKSNSLDDILTAKLNALSGENGVNLEKLLASDDSSSDDSSTKHKKKKKKKKNKKKKSKEKHDRDIDISDKSKTAKKTSKDQNEKYIGVKESIESRNDRYKYSDKKDSCSKKHKSYDSDVTDGYSSKRRKVSPERYESKKYYQDSRDIKKRKETHEHGDRESCEHSKGTKENDKIRIAKKVLNDNEKAARLAEMVAAGAEREVERGKRVAKQLSEIAADEKAAKVPRSSSHNEARALPDSLENRIRSNKHYIQRDRRHMNEHFARR